MRRRRKGGHPRVRSDVTNTPSSTLSCRKARSVRAGRCREVAYAGREINSTSAKAAVVLEGAPHLQDARCRLNCAAFRKLCSILTCICLQRQPFWDRLARSGDRGGERRGDGGRSLERQWRPRAPDQCCLIWPFDRRVLPKHGPMNAIFLQGRGRKRSPMPRRTRSRRGRHRGSVSKRVHWASCGSGFKSGGSTQFWRFALMQALQCCPRLCDRQRRFAL